MYASAQNGQFINPQALSASPTPGKLDWNRIVSHRIASMPLAGRMRRMLQLDFHCCDTAFGWRTRTDAGWRAGLSNPIAPSETSPRGIKRSHSPDTYSDLPGDNLGEDGMYLYNQRQLRLVTAVAPVRRRAAILKHFC